MNLNEIFSQFFSDLVSMLPKVIAGIIVLIFFWILGKLFYKFIGKRRQLKWKDRIISNFMAGATKWSFYIFGQ